jgi:hypothetical protein
MKHGPAKLQDEDLETILAVLEIKLMQLKDENERDGHRLG